MRDSTSTEITTRGEELAELRRQRDRQIELIAHLDEARQTVKDLQAGLKEAVAQLPDTKEIPDLLSGISAVARDAGLEIAQFRQRPQVYHDFYAEVPVEILVRGTYFQVEGFFRQVSELTRIVNIGNIVMKAPSVIQSDFVELSTSCSATTFRFLDEEERERIRKEREKEKK